MNSSGDFCYDSKNAYECYNIGDCEDVMYITDSFNTKDSIDINMWGENTRLSYNCIATGQDANNMYCCTGSAMNSTYNFYSNNCIGCSYVFGCSGLRNKSYCIFNKQYAEEEYTKTLKIIIKQMQAEGTWGEFLDQRYAFYAYNESHAMEQMPLSREEAIAK